MLPIFLTFLIFFSVLLTGCFSVQAQEISAEEPNTQTNAALRRVSTKPNAFSDGISGMVVNNTISATGQQFFQLFTQTWRENADSENYSLTVSETTSRQRGTQVFIYMGSKLLFTSGVSPKFSLLKPVVDQAIDSISTRLISDAMESVSTDPDLAQDEL
jgi:hypothetical protein